MKTAMFRPLATFVTLSLLSASALAHDTVGELTAAGGKLLADVEEVKKLVTNSRMTGHTRNAGQTYPIDFELKKNGKIDGTARGRNGVEGVWGTWEVNDKAQLCMDRQYNGGSSQGCIFIYVVDGKYFISGKNESDARLIDRAFKPL